MIGLNKFRAIGLMLMMIVAVPGLAFAQGLIGKGAVVIAGHSFHAPSGPTVKRVAGDIGAGEVETVFVAGARGTLSALWQNQSKRTQILNTIDDINASALVLTSTGGQRGESDALAGWIEAARAVSPDIAIVLSPSHPPRGGQTSTEDYTRTSAFVYANTLALADSMQRQFPSAEIAVLEGGLAASAAKTLSDQGSLPSDFRVFRDRLGHASQQVYNVQGAAWASELYGLSDPAAHLDISQDQAAVLNLILNEISDQADTAASNPPSQGLAQRRGFGLRRN